MMSIFCCCRKNFTINSFANIGRRHINIQPGTYEVHLEAKSTNSFVLNLKLNNDDDQIIIPIKSDESLQIPYEGNIKIAGKDIAQPFNINGTIRREDSDSETTTTEEVCSYSEFNKNCDSTCSDPILTIKGKHSINSHSHITKRILDITFNDLNTNAELGVYNAIGIDNEKVVESQTECK